MKPNTLIKCAFAVLLFTIAGLISVGSWAIYRSTITPSTPGEQKKSILQENTEPVFTDPDCELHVSYNSLTNNRSKMIATRSGEKVYVLMGSQRSNGHPIRCEVSKDFFDSTSENSHISIPCSKCREIQP